jgi:hypothetical protein
MKNGKGGWWKDDVTLNKFIFKVHNKIWKIIFWLIFVKFNSKILVKN